MTWPEFRTETCTEALSSQRANSRLLSDLLSALSLTWSQNSQYARFTCGASTSTTCSSARINKAEIME